MIYLHLANEASLKWKINLIKFSINKKQLLKFGAAFQRSACVAAPHIECDRLSESINYSMISSFLSFRDKPSFSFKRATTSGSYCFVVLCFTTTAVVLAG